MSRSLDLVLLLSLRVSQGLRLVELERAWKLTIQPLLGLLYHTPDLKVGLALSGEVLRALQDHFPAGAEWTRAMLERGQIELVGGAFHEPVLHAIPEEDAVGQIRAHAAAVKKLFGGRPTGVWLPWGTWDPALPRIFHKAAVDWTAVDERWIRDASGISQPQGVFRTEREGMDVALIPLDTAAGSLVGRASIRGLINSLRQYPSLGRGAAVLALEVGDPAADPERAQGWMVQFVQALAAAAPVLRTVRVSEYLERAGRAETVYLPSSPAVPWESALARYPEANRMHKAMVRVSEMLLRFERKSRTEAWGSVIDPDALVQARRYLYQAQHAEAYSHGLHAGIYDPKRRFSTWRDILRAEQTLLTALGATDVMEIESGDEDCSGVEQVSLRTDTIRARIDPGLGGALVGFRHYGASRELISVVARRSEPWQEALVAETQARTFSETPEEFRRLSGWDGGQRLAFVEHWMNADEGLEDWLRGTHRRTPNPRPWTVVSSERFGDDALRTMLTAEGSLGESEQKYRLHKRYSLQRAGALEVRLDLVNRSHEPLRTRFGWEINLALDADAGDDLLVIGETRRVVDEPMDLGEISEFSLAGEGMQVHLAAERPPRVWVLPVQTLHRDHGQKVTAVQGHALLLQWPVDLWPNEKARFKVVLTVMT